MFFGYNRQSSARRTSRKRTFKKKYPVRKYTGKLPARFNNSRKRYSKSRTINSFIRNTIGETKLLPLTDVKELQPIPIYTGAGAYMANFNIGTTPVGWTSYNSIGGDQIIQGNASNERIGNYVYLRQSTLNIIIDMQNNIENNVLHEFRFIVFKSRRANSPAGLQYSPSQALFLKNTGDALGVESPGPVDEIVYFLALTNKRNFVIYKDQRFILSPPQTIPEGTETASGFNSKYPSSKRMLLKLPHMAKTNYNNSNIPTDLDTKYGICILSRPIGTLGNRADNWEVSILSSCTSFTDV